MEQEEDPEKHLRPPLCSRPPGETVHCHSNQGPHRLRKVGCFLRLPGIWLDLASLRGRAREKTGVLGLASVKKGNTWKGQGGYFLLLQCLGFLLSMNRIWGKA